MEMHVCMRERVSTDTQTHVYYSMNMHVCMYVAHVSSYYYMRPHTTIRVSSCMRILWHEDVRLYVRYARTL
jgi:hypothetical protein